MDVVLTPKNSSINEIDNLINLNNFNLNHILDILEKRYLNEIYYTEASLTLIALNPFKNVDYLYSKNLIEFYFKHSNSTLSDLNAYDSKSIVTNSNLKDKIILNSLNLNAEIIRSDDRLNSLLNSSPKPHIFKNVSETWKNLSNYFSSKKKDSKLNLLKCEKNQTIIVSGVSGSGKTRSVSYIMYYFTHILNTNRAKSIENVLLIANVILESFGNAKTRHNDNSSRFGKYIQLNFSNNMSIFNVKINTYLLEKTRVLNEIQNERNFHIFYQLIAGTSQQQKNLWGLNNTLARKFFKENNTYDDSVKWQVLQNAFNQLRIRNIDQIYKIIISIAHLSSCTFAYEKRGEENEVEFDIDQLDIDLNTKCKTHLNHAAQLLGFKTDDLKNLFLTQELVISHDNKRKNSVIKKKCNLNEAKSRKDSLIKLIYSSLFKWLVNKINENLNKILTDNLTTISDEQA